MNHITVTHWIGPNEREYVPVSFQPVEEIEREMSNVYPPRPAAADPNNAGIKGEQNDNPNHCNHSV